MSATLADLKRCPDAKAWAEQIQTLEGMRDRLVDVMNAENAA